MPADLKFNVRVTVINPEVLPEIQGRMEDLSPAFHAIYGEWVGINAQKFDSARGMEAAGADIFGEEWAGLTPAYMKQKHPSGAPQRRRMKPNSQGYTEYPDWLMVRSGALMQAMTDPEALFQMFDKQQAAFGTPNDPDLANIVMWQTGAKQKERFVVFISEPDMNAIERNLQDYFSLGPNFAKIKMAQGMAALDADSGNAALDAAFDVATGE